MIVTIQQPCIAPRSKKYKQLWHRDEYFILPTEGEIIVCKREDQSCSIERVSSDLDTDEIIEWAYLNDLI